MRPIVERFAESQKWAKTMSQVMPRPFSIQPNHAPQCCLAQFREESRGLLQLLSRSRMCRGRSGLDREETPRAAEMPWPCHQPILGCHAIFLTAMGGGMKPSQEPQSAARCFWCARCVCVSNKNIFSQNELFPPHSINTVSLAPSQSSAEPPPTLVTDGELFREYRAGL